MKKTVRAIVKFTKFIFCIYMYIHFYYLKIIYDLHFTPMQVFIEQNVISTTVRTRNDEKKILAFTDR